MIRVCICVALFAAASTARCDEPELPTPQDGFEWQWCEEAGVAILRPVDWHFKHAVQDGTYAYAISKEDIEQHGEFKTGLTVNMVSNVARKTGMSAADYASAFTRAAIKEKRNVLSLRPPSKQGRLTTFGYRVRQDGTIVHALLVADVMADKLYLVLFESPEDTWDDAWQIGKQIMKTVHFDIPE